jgi:hypothetical protein
MSLILTNSRREVKRLSEAAKAIYREADAAVVKRVISDNGITPGQRFASEITGMQRIKRACRGRWRYKTPIRSLTQPVNKSAIAELVEAGAAYFDSKSIMLSIDTRDRFNVVGREIFDVL